MPNLDLPVPYVGKHVERKHLEEFFRTHRESDEIVIAIIDGIFFDAAGKRIGGMTLHDYFVVTDRHAVLWARGLQTDVLDRFQFAGVSISSRQADALHGEMWLDLAPPSVPKAARLRFDLVPWQDVEITQELFNQTKSLVTGTGQTGEAERIRGLVDAAMEIPATRRPAVSEPVASTHDQFRREPVPPPAYASESLPDPDENAPESGRRDASGTSYSMYRAAQLMHDAIGTFPKDIGRTIGLDQTLSKLIDRMPRIENLSQIAEVINAFNQLLVTLSSNPAARDLALHAIDRMIEQGSPIRAILNYIRSSVTMPPATATTTTATPDAAAQPVGRRTINVSFGAMPNAKPSVAPPAKPEAANPDPAPVRTDAHHENELELVGSRQ